MSQTLFHVTSTDALQGITKTGLNAFSYWSTDAAIASYYGDTIEDEGLEPITLTIELDDLIAHVGADALEPDFPGIEEPICTALGKRESDVLIEWRNSRREWRDSLAVVHSLRCRAPIAPGVLRQLGCKETINERGGSLMVGAIEAANATGYKMQMIETIVCTQSKIDVDHRNDDAIFVQGSQRRIQDRSVQFDFARFESGLLNQARQEQYMDYLVNNVPCVTYQPTNGPDMVLAPASRPTFVMQEFNGVSAPGAVTKFCLNNMLPLTRYRSCPDVDEAEFLTEAMRIEASVTKDVLAHQSMEKTIDAWTHGSGIYRTLHTRKDESGGRLAIVRLCLSQSDKMLEVLRTAPNDAGQFVTESIGEFHLGALKYAVLKTMQSAMIERMAESQDSVPHEKCRI